MNHKTGAMHFRGIRRAFAAVLLILLFGALGPGNSLFHELIHADHDSPTHSCFMTLLDHGQLDLPVENVAAPSASPVPLCGLLPSLSVPASEDLTLPGVRGPPCLS